MLFVMGATGRMGGAVLRHAATRTRAASRSGRPVEGADETVLFDLDEPTTFAHALTGCTALFVMRPPSVTTRKPFDQLMVAARDAGIGHVICALVYGAEHSRVLPHRHMEAAVRASGIAHTFLRPADFMQNLAHVHGQRIREHDEIAVPAGRGCSAFLDVEDVGHAAAAILRNPKASDGKGFALTGPDALTFADVAETMSAVLGRTVRYRAVSVPRFIIGELRAGRPGSMALVMSALYSVQRFGWAAPVDMDFEQLTGRKAGDLARYFERERRQFTSMS